MAGVAAVIGLANPGRRYAPTRHNAGAWWVGRLAEQVGTELREEARLKSSCAQAAFAGDRLRLMVPTTYMNHSGQAVQAFASFYKLAPDALLIAHDELDLPPGTVRLKLGGGHGGHNGLRSVMQQLGSREFWRLRIGIGHPGHRDDVVDYVLSRPSADEEAAIGAGIERAVQVVPLLARGEFERAMHALHSEPASS